MALNTHTANVFLPGCLGPVRREVVLVEDAEADLAALREELADANRHCVLLSTAESNQHFERDALQQRLTAAEQRNETLTTLLREGLEEYKNGDDWIDRVIAALRDKPTESGASE